ncbi:ClpX C4-type zinc finger protein [Niallia taxi]|nr:ClpX C4-type zinc finger protein [Niallia taxi]MDK8643296.1 ClpX C4-type zinc finger protein [Niallia taxi]MED4055196.1 ClpX C4-type zinc finger protein [Niallia taxi]
MDSCSFCNKSKDVVGELAMGPGYLFASSVRIWQRRH